MSFNDLSFLFIFFPVILLLHKVVRGRGRNIVLLIGSLVFFAWGSPEYLILMVVIILFNYFSGLQIQAQKEQEKWKEAKFTLISSAVVDLLLLGFFKYWGFLLDNINAIFHSDFSAGEIEFPIGVSFFTFSILSYLFDVYRDKAPAAKNLLDFALYVTFFPKLVSGPIVPYAKMEEQLRNRKTSPAKFGSGCRLFVIGLAKKVLLSNSIGNTFYAVSALSSNEVSVVTAWLGTISYGLMLYFDFSGYSDMAIGLGQMFGFDFDKNFEYPYISASDSEFWRRWHISLGSWFREYVYFPMGGSRCSVLKTIRNLMAVWLLTGIWHGASWNFVFWGVYHGVILVLEKFVLKDVLEKIPKKIRQIFTLLVVFVGWVFFFSTSLGNAFQWLGQMIGVGANGFVDSTALYYLRSGIVMILIGIFACSPTGCRMASSVYRKGSKALLLSVVWFIMLFLLSLAGMMTSTYSTFLYAAF